MCERELETKQNCNLLTPTLLVITAFLSRSPGLLNRKPVGPASLGGGFLYHILSPTCLIPNWLIGGLRAPSAGWWLSLPHLVFNWLNFLCTELYNSSTPTFFLWASQITLIQPIHGQGYTLLFLDWMHLLFTQVHFLFWQPGQVKGEYTTDGPFHVSDNYEYEPLYKLPYQELFLYKRVCFHGMSLWHRIIMANLCFVHLWTLFELKHTSLCRSHIIL